MTVSLSDHQHFPWGYQIRADFKADGQVYQEVLVFKTSPVRTDPANSWVLEWTLPTQTQVDAAVAAAQARVGRMLADAAAELAPKLLGHRITSEDGTVIDV